MSETLFVRWTITPLQSPQPLLHCRRCACTTSFKSSGKIRVNANGKRVDAWLIYRCTSCDGTWNRPVLERRQVGSIDPALLSSLSANDPEIADRIAFDIDGLRHWAPRFVKAEEYSVAKEVLSACAPQPRELRILCAVPYRVSLRLDRLLADELDLSRSRIHALSESGELSVEGGKRALRKPVRDGAEVRVSLPAQDAEAMASRASEAAS